ncbi:MAG: universal stress protein [Candidatus Bathyarchaeia archaeon]|jgi:nucleotide-binding universal stress UspA family protein
MQSEGVFRRILVPVDESLSSMLSQELAVFLAKKFGSQVTVLHVASHEIMIPLIERPQGTQEVESISTSLGFPRAVEIPKPRGNALPQEVVNEISNWYVERGSRLIEEAVGRFKNDGLAVEEKLVEQGDPADVIVTEAEKGRYNLIIMGNSGEKERDQHLGSVAKKVVTHAKIPVLITRNKTVISRMLVPVDGSEKSEKAIQYAEALAEKTEAKMTLLYVQESTLFTLKPEISTEMGNHILANAAGRVTRTQPESKLESGDPAKKIIETAKKGNYDLIVMSSKGHGTVRRFIMGSVSNHVIHYSDRSFLLIK